MPAGPGTCRAPDSTRHWPSWAERRSCSSGCRQAPLARRPALPNPRRLRDPHLDGAPQHPGRGLDLIAGQRSFADACKVPVAVVRHLGKRRHLGRCCHPAHRLPSRPKAAIPVRAVIPVKAAIPAKGCHPGQRCHPGQGCHPVKAVIPAQAGIHACACAQAAARLWCAEKHRTCGRARSATRQLTRRGCLSAANAANAASSATRPQDRASQGSQAQHRPHQ